MGEWIKCKDRLPIHDKNELYGNTYIVSGKMKYDFEEDYTYFTDCANYLPLCCDEHWPLGNTGGTDWGTWNDWYEGQHEYEILAWQPLPESYTESEE